MQWIFFPTIGWLPKKGEYFFPPSVGQTFRQRGIFFPTVGWLPKKLNIFSHQCVGQTFRQRGGPRLTQAIIAFVSASNITIVYEHQFEHLSFLNRYTFHIGIHSVASVLSRCVIIFAHSPGLCVIQTYDGSTLFPFNLCTKFNF